MKDVEVDYHALELELTGGSSPPAVRVYVTCLSTFIVSFMVGGASLLAPFFAGSPAGIAVGPTAVGFTFAAFPLATAIATPLPPLALQRFGARTTVGSGLCLLSLSSLAFGLLPMASIFQLESSSATMVPVLAAGLIAARVVGGVGAALCEAGCLTTISSMGWGDHLGKAYAGVELATGSGATFGAALGGWAYQEGSALLGAALPSRAQLSMDALAFLTPLLAAALLPLCLLPPVLCVLPAAPGSSDEEAAPLREHLTLPRIAVALSLLFAGAACEGLNPILEPRAPRRQVE